MRNGLWGIENAIKIEQSGIRRFFTPHAPIDDMSLFMGRQDEVASAVHALTTPGQHMIIFGERGVGKSSLANVACRVLLQSLAGGRAASTRCGGDDTYQTVWHRLLLDLELPVPAAEVREEQTRGGAADLRLPFASAGVDTARKTQTVWQPSPVISPAYVVEQLRDSTGLVVIDEIDGLTDTNDRRRLAETVKHLSDTRSSVTLLLVGIAEMAAELVGHHPSVERCMRQIRLGPMSASEVRGIVTIGATRCGLEFAPAVVDQIVELSAGYPHFAHLLALKTAEETVVRDSVYADTGMFELGLQEAVKDADETRTLAFAAATRSVNTDLYRMIVVAAAQIEETEFTAATLRARLAELVDREITQQTINSHLKRLVSEDTSGVIRRLSKGVYRFTDPRLRSYVRMVVRSEQRPNAPSSELPAHT